MKTIHLYLIHTPELIHRIKYINSTIDMIKKIVEKNNMILNINTIINPSKDIIENNINIFNSRVKYELEEGEYADEQFNKTIAPLNVVQISNIEKHREALKNISLLNDDDYYFIIEDDLLISNDYVKNIEDFFSNLEKNNDWDILFTGLSNIDDEPLKLVDSRGVFKFFILKNSYFIRPLIAKKLYDYLNIFKYTLKNSISKFIWDNKEIRSKITNKHLFLEGSKIGLFLSSINNSNFLYQNNDFVELAKITNKDAITDDDILNAEKIYKRLEHYNNSDIQHTMGLIYYKKKDYKKSKQYMIDACLNIKKYNGYLTKTNEILNNCINMFQYDQIDLEECKKLKSKYSFDK